MEGVETVEKIKKYDQARVYEPGNIYLPQLMREKIGLNIGDYVKLLLNEEDGAILIRSRE